MEILSIARLLNFTIAGDSGQLVQFIRKQNQADQGRLADLRRIDLYQTESLGWQVSLTLHRDGSDPMNFSAVLPVDHLAADVPQRNRVLSAMLFRILQWPYRIDP